MTHADALTSMHTAQTYLYGGQDTPLHLAPSVSLEPGVDAGDEVLHMLRIGLHYGVELGELSESTLWSVTTTTINMKT